MAWVGSYIFGIAFFILAVVMKAIGADWTFFAFLTVASFQMANVLAVQR